MNEGQLSLSWRFVGKAFSLNAVGLGLPGLVALLAIPQTLLSLGPERFGLVSLLWSLLIASSAFDLGMGRALTRNISTLRGNASQINRLAAISLAFSSVVGLAISTAIFVAGWQFFPERLLEFRSFAGSPILFFALMACIPAQACAVVARGYYEGAGDFLRSNIQRVVVNVVTLLAPLISYVSTGELGLAVALMLGVRLIFVVLFALKIINRSLFRGGEYLRSDFLVLWGFGSVFSIESLTKAVSAQFDRFFLWSVAGGALIAAYAVPFDLNAQLLLPLGAITTAIFPLLCSERGSRAAFRFAVKYSLLAFSLYALASIVLVLFADAILSMWLGGAKDPRMVHVLQSLSVGLPFYAVSSVMTSFLHSRGLVTRTLTIAIGSGACSILVMWATWSIGELALFPFYWGLKYLIECAALTAVSLRVAKP